MDTESREGVLPSALIIPLAQCLVGIVLFVALLKHQRDITLLSLLVFGTIFGAKFWSRQSLARLSCRLSLGKQRVFPGEQVCLEVKAENAKFLPVWLQISVSVDDALCPSRTDTPLTCDSTLLWFQQASFRWDFLAQRRGMYHIGTAGIKVGDPFGFFPHSKQSDEQVQLLVYPRLIPLKPFAIPRRDFFGIPGAESPIQDPVYILGTRDYQHSQAAKHIHWKASARHNRLQEKVFEPTAQEKVLIVFDVGQFTGNDAGEPFERALEVIASLACRLDRQGYAVGLATNGTLKAGGAPILPVSRNPQQLAAILDLLARLQPVSRETLFETLRRRPIVGAGISCLYFSCQGSATDLSSKHYFSNRKVPVIFFVNHPPSTSRRFRRDVYALNDIIAESHDTSRDTAAVPENSMTTGEKSE